MQSILNSALPFFALIFCGYVARTSSAILVSTAVFMISVSALLFVLH